MLSLRLVPPLHRLNRRPLNLTGLLACAGLYGYALIAERVFGYAPCPLCILQRGALIAMLAAFALATAHSPPGRLRHLYSGLGLVPAGIGSALAGRHLWLQSLPADQIPPCSAGFSFLVERLGALAAVRETLRASGECAEADWLIFGITAPAWVLAAFVGLGLWAAYANSVCTAKTSPR